MIRTTRYLTIFLAIFVSTVIAVSGQTPRRDFNRPQQYDVDHYVLRVSFDRRAKKVISDTSIRLKPLKDNFSSAEFDAVGISFTSVTLESEGTGLKYRTAGHKIFVTLDKPYNASETITLRFRHTSVPKKGVYFVTEQKAADGKVIHSDQIWTQGEPDEARHWFPSFDFPADKATTEQYITVPAGETVVGNGELVEEMENGNGTVTHHFRLNVPIPTYLVSLVIGKYAKVSDSYGTVPLGYYVYPGTESIVPLAYKNTKEMLRFFEERTGLKYPFNKYDQTIVANFAFGGMENATATTMADTEIFLARNQLFVAGVEDLVSHEVAHSWFGNLVTCRNWAELWLNEGFATFMEAAFREKMYGRRNYIIKIQRDAEAFITDEAVNKKRNALFNQNADDVSALFERPATTYNKGGAVLHTLREEIGDDAFWKGVNIYLTRHREGSVETPDLLKAMEEASGRDLHWFFDQWVYMAGHPKLSVREVWVPETKTLRLTVTQTQRADRITPAVFRLPMDVEFTMGSENKTERLDIAKRTETFSINLPAKPDSIKFDPMEKIPVKTVDSAGR